MKSTFLQIVLSASLDTDTTTLRYKNSERNSPSQFMVAHCYADMEMPTMRFSTTSIKKVLLSLLFIATALLGTAQYLTNAAELRELIREAPHDTTKAQALLYLAVLIRDSKPDSVYSLCTQSLRVTREGEKSSFGSFHKASIQKVYRRINATAKLNIGHYHHERGDSKLAIDSYKTAFDEFRSIGFDQGAKDALQAMIECYKENGDPDVGNMLANKNAKILKAPTYGVYGSIGFRAPGWFWDQGDDTVQSNETPRQIPVVQQKQVAPVTQPKEQTYSNRLDSRDTLDQNIRWDELQEMEEMASLEPTFQEPLVVSVPSTTPLAEMGIDTAVIARYRDRLAKPIRKNGGALEALEQFELGEAWELMREPTLAMTSFKRSQELYGTLRSDSGECVALLRIGKLRGDQREYETAFAVLDSARQKAQAIGSRDLEGIALAGMGDMCRKIEECGGATELYRRSIELANATGDKRTEARGYLGMTEELVKSGSPSKAAPLGQKGLDLATEVDDAELKQQGASLLCGVFASLGRLKESQEMGELAQSIEAYLAKRDHAMDSIITAIQSNFTKTRERDSIAYREVRTTLESNWMGERVKAAKNRNIALLIMLCSLVVIVLGTVYYRIDRRRRQVRAERISIELEIKALRAQMNPHFLFNALSSIHEHILENEAEAAAGYLAKFSKLMRHVLEMSRLNEVTIKRELDVLGMYTELEQMRLKGRFIYSVLIAPDVDPKAIAVPPMLLQPFIENAVWHGLSGKEGPGNLRITVAKVSGALHVTIDDDGVGRQVTTEKKSGHTSLGTSITKERLDLWAAQRGAPATFTFVPVAIGTRVLLVLPWDEV